jgi:cell wall-associated NlpC family hydrolase
MTREDLVSEARSWIGTPWHHRACIKGVGIDCIRLIEALAKFCKIIGDDFVTPDYGPEPDGILLRKVLDQHLIPTEKKEPGNVVLLAPGDRPQHVGILAPYKHGGLSMIHACNAKSCVPPRVIETRLLFARNMKFVASYSFPGIT